MKEIDVGRGAKNHFKSYLAALSVVFYWSFYLMMCSTGAFTLWPNKVIIVFSLPLNYFTILSIHIYLSIQGR